MTLGLAGIAVMSGLWQGYSSSPRPITDINGKALAVGDTVKLVCKVSAINTTAAHFDAVTIQTVHPEGDPVLCKESFTVDPKQLLSGA